MKPFEADRYRGQWVAFDPNTNAVVGHGPTLAAAEQQAVDAGIQAPELYRVPVSDAYFVG